MKEGILVIIMAIFVVITYSQKQVIKRLDKLIELNTPEYINVIPDVVITEKH